MGDTDTRPAENADASREAGTQPAGHADSRSSKQAEGRGAARSPRPEPVRPGTAPVRRWAEVLRNRPVAEETWWLELRAPEIGEASVPGQFVMIGFGLEGVGAPFIPRPFSVGWRAEDGRVGLLVRAFGAGTRRLGALREEDRVLLLGPLGTGFGVNPQRPVTCVAGGVGLAPFLFLVPWCRQRGVDVRLLYGERTGARVFDPELVRELTGGEVEVWTEDGSRGRKGLVLEGLDLSADPQVMACGPTPMLRAVAERARAGGHDLQLSVEEHMACGVGTCQGCVVPLAAGGWAKACTRGPVFDAEVLSWEER